VDSSIDSPWRPETGDNYVRSYLVLRIVIGALGILLPVLLIVGDIFFLEGSPKARGSISAYYHSGMRDVFVVILAATALFLITYKIFERKHENSLSIVAGVTALGVALFPTGIPSDNASLPTPLQDRLGQDEVSSVHFTCAVIFLICTAVISYFFGVQEGKRKPQPGKRPPKFWKWFHWACAGVIAGALIFVVVCKAGGWLDDYCVLIGEVAATAAFGTSWLVKGAERDFLRRTPTPPGLQEAPERARVSA
jgi:CDP-diglyceride synthetase